MSERRIFKFYLNPWESEVEMQRGAKLLHVHEQNGHGCVWAEVDIDAPLVKRNLICQPTGAPMLVGGTYIGSFHLDEENSHMGRVQLVFHVYDAGEVE